MDQFIGEIRMVGFNFAPMGWALCNGQTLSIQQYSALYALLGTTFGGNGTSNFNLPDLQGRVPVDVGNGAGLPAYAWGDKGGVNAVTLQAANIPAHTHPIATPVSNVAGTASSPVNAVPAVDSTTVTLTDAGQARATAVSKGYAASAVSGQTAAPYSSGPSSGGGTPVTIEPPYLAVYFIISLTGIFPTRE
jgi:microcystin-dependent protein